MVCVFNIILIIPFFLPGAMRNLVAAALCHRSASVTTKNSVLWTLLQKTGHLCSGKTEQNSVFVMVLGLAHSAY